MARLKGILKLQRYKKEVIFYTLKETIKYESLDDFLYASFGKEGVEVYVSFNELNTLHRYFYKNLKEGYSYKAITINQKITKRIGISLFKPSKQRADKTFYDLYYKIGADDLDINYMLNEIEDIEHYNSGYTSKLRKELKVEERLVKHTIDNLPSMTPIIYSSPFVEYKNVQCYDSCSFYPYWLTQPLPHFDKIVKFESEKQFEEEGVIYYGGIKIKGLEAKKPYFPLTLVGKNNKGITIESQGRGIRNRGKQLIAAEEITLCGFIPHLLALLKENYNYESYQISPDLIRFTLKIDEGLREVVLKYFEAKQNKKRNNLPYHAEKILLNRIYGYFITSGNTAPAHYGQYIVSKARLTLNNLAHKVGFKDIVHMHTDSIKFVGNHTDAIEEYNSTVEFPELGRFVLEDVFQKCTYYSHITAKYIDKEGKLGFKHGGIEEEGLKLLAKKRYEDVNEYSKFVLIKYWDYDEDGFNPYGVETDFSHSIREEIE